MSQRNYYEAYDDRYRQIHEMNLQWFQSEPSPIVSLILDQWAVPQKGKMLEIGCGEGRDAFPLLQEGYDLIATDISAEAIRFCQEQMPCFADRFQVLDCIEGELEGQFDFIYAIAVVHMLVETEDRMAFYQFIKEHLSPTGIALICTMGDGEMEFQSDIRNAFSLQDRVHEQSGTPVKIASTSCRVVSFPFFRNELIENGLTVLQEGITSVEPDFPKMMYAVVK